MAFILLMLTNLYHRKLLDFLMNTKELYFTIKIRILKKCLPMKSISKNLKV